jgi:hypothetical protein
LVQRENIFNKIKVSGLIFRKGGEGGRGAKSLLNSILLPLKLEAFGGEGRGSKLYYYNFDYINMLCPHVYFKILKLSFLTFVFVAKLLSYFEKCYPNN